MRNVLLAMVIITVFSIISLAGCSSSYSSQPASTASSTSSTTQVSSPSPSASQFAVNIASFAFSPATLTIAKGATVMWTNNDSTTHTVTSDSNVWDSGSVAPGKTFSRTFNEAGTFPYHCNIHPSMTSKIVVQ
jgi:plastocyanin